MRHYRKLQQVDNELIILMILFSFIFKLNIYDKLDQLTHGFTYLISFTQIQRSPFLDICRPRDHDPNR